MDRHSLSLPSVAAQRCACCANIHSFEIPAAVNRWNMLKVAVHLALVKKHLPHWLWENSAKAHMFCTNTGLLLCIVWPEKDCFGPLFSDVLPLPADKILGVRISSTGQMQRTKQLLSNTISRSMCQEPYPASSNWSPLSVCVLYHKNQGPLSSVGLWIHGWL